MDTNTLGIYIHELRNQSNYTEASFGLFNQSLQGGNAMGVLYSAQNILMAASQIACLLWPTRARNRGRGEALRKALDLPEKHPLNDRRLSELPEAGDQKLEEWISNTRGKKIIFDFVGPVSRIPEEEAVTEESIFRAYDPETKIFYFRGLAYNLDAVAKAVGGVGGRIIQLHHRLFPEQAEAERKAAEEAQAAAQAAQASSEAAPEAPAPAVEEEKPAAKKKAPAKKKPAAKKKAPAKKKAAK